MSNQYICKNKLNCGKADDEEVIEIELGMEPHCPECNSALTSMDGTGSEGGSLEAGLSNRKPLIIGASVVTVLVAAIASALTLGVFESSNETSQEPPTVAAASPTPAVPEPAPSASGSQLNAMQMDCDTLRQSGDKMADKVCSFVAARALVDAAGMNLVKKDYKLAEENLGLALERAPDFFYVHLRYAELFSQRQEFQRSFDSLKKAVELEPGIAAQVMTSSELEALFLDQQYGARARDLIKSSGNAMADKV